ncbi:MFS transporter [Amycolatopsis acidiphila]|uniref:MFS transporter n=1 Tax=Amycolatopsis acidiphila TaxID=715473 RepID=A0A557ZQ33_9PSEU|nr:MFS transporter [Amycolatopsis acidiphila]TVT14052.1 MFS transporter [Amycolatopsis acidiphila]UIJ63604.1 MFS transporter [Amycolatopsis acidiphila]GHG67983.1 MFS transporter [Amycolatopsis acidiphila]
MKAPLTASRSPRTVLVAAMLSITNFVAVFDGLVVTVALPSIQASLGMRRLDAQWLITAYAVGLGGMLLFGGRCGDRYGRQTTLVAGLLVFVAGLLLAGFAWAPWPMFAGRALQGFGAAFAVPNSFAIISALRPAERRNRVFAAVAVAGGLVTQGLGWRFVFLLTVPVAAAAAVVAAKVLDEARAAAPAEPDLLAAGLSVAGLALLVLAITDVERAGPLGRETLSAFGLAAAALVGFALRERRTAAPLVPVRLLRDRALRAAVGGLPGFVFAYDGTVFVGLLFLQQAAGFGPVEAGLAFGPLGVAVLAGSPVAGFLLRRLRWTVVVAGAQLTCVAGLVLLVRVPVTGGYSTHFLPGLVLIGLGAAVSAIAFNGAAGSEADPRDQGSVYGIYETAKYLSGAIVVATLATAAATRATAADGYRLAFAVSAVIALVGGVVPLLLARRGTGAMP